MRAWLVCDVFLIRGRRGEGCGFREVSIRVVGAARIARGVDGTVEIEDRVRTLAACGHDRARRVEGGEGGG